PRCGTNGACEPRRDLRSDGVARSGDRATTRWHGLPTVPQRGPCHNETYGRTAWHGRETGPQRDRGPVGGPCHNEERPASPPSPGGEGRGEGASPRESPGLPPHPQPLSPKGRGAGVPPALKSEHVPSGRVVPQLASAAGAAARGTDLAPSAGTPGLHRGAGPLPRRLPSRTL